MPHSMIVGTSGSGKSFFGAELTKTLYKSFKKLNVVITNVGGDFSKHHRYRGDEAVQFNETLRSPYNTARHVFIDEAHSVIGRGNQAKPFNWMARVGRHHGHFFWFMTQEPKDVEPSFRGQCEYWIIFRLSQGKADWLAKDLGVAEVANASLLETGNFILIKNYQLVGYYRLKA